MLLVRGGELDWSSATAAGCKGHDTVSPYFPAKVSLIDDCCFDLPEHVKEIEHTYDRDWKDGSTEYFMPLACVDDEEEARK